MSNQPFQFKQFTIHQDRCAMKIGTDAVLLGAWTEVSNQVESILDIGTGTGILSLQLAQRSNAEIIDAIEIEPNAYEQAFENFEKSDWGDRLFCYHTSLQEFTEEMDEKYDLIVSNPPYFDDTFKELKEERATARHTITLAYNELLENVAKLLAENGSFSLILPYDKESNFLHLAEKVNLYPDRITRTRGNSKSQIKRSLLQLKFGIQNTHIEELIIEIDRHQYTEEYKELVKDFYLKM